MLCVWSFYALSDQWMLYRIKWAFLASQLSVGWWPGKIGCFYLLTLVSSKSFFPPTDHMKVHNHSHSNGSLEEELKSVWETVDVHLPGMQQSTTQNHPSGSRRKRFLSYPRFVELMVTADAKMVRHHGRNLEHYILTIMSVVSKMFFKTITLILYIFNVCELCFTLFSGLLGLSEVTFTINMTWPFFFDIFFFLYFFYIYIYNITFHVHYFPCKSCFYE